MMKEEEVYDQKRKDTTLWNISLTTLLPVPNSTNNQCKKGLLSHGMLSQKQITFHYHGMLSKKQIGKTNGFEQVVQLP